MRKLIFTIAQNGYGFAYQRCIQSHQSYATAIGAEFVCVSRPARVPDSALSAWLKIPLLLSALRGGYDAVAYIDADCEVRSDAPDFAETIPLQIGDVGSIHMARGVSTRLNSGVIMAGRGPVALSFLERVLSSMSESIPAEDRKDLKFENGNVIYCARETGNVTEMPLEWNNTFDQDRRDFVRHYTGSLRRLYRRPLLADLAYRVLRRTVYRQLPQPESREMDFQLRLAQLTTTVAEAYPAFSEQRVSG